MLSLDNSLIDIWNNGSITSLSDIYLKSMSQNKTVNSLFLNDNNNNKGKLAQGVSRADTATRLALEYR